MKAFVVALVIGVVCCAGAGPADAAEGSKQFLKDCTLHMLGYEGRGGVPLFEARDIGSECGEYAIRGISLVTTSGRYQFTGSTAMRSLHTRASSSRARCPRASRTGPWTCTSLTGRDATAIGVRSNAVRFLDRGSALRCL